MSTSLHLCTPDDAQRLQSLVAAFHTEFQIERDEAQQEAALAPLLDGSPHGAVWLLGLPRAPVGYVVVTFGWSLELGGLDGTISELYVRPAVRKRGIASEALNALSKTLAASGLKALHLTVDDTNESAQRFFRRNHYEHRDGLVAMSRQF